VVIERVARRFAGVVWEVGEHFIMHPELFERCKHAMTLIKAGNFEGADRLMKETAATKEIWAATLK
jgi:hypothetical protein